MTLLNYGDNPMPGLDIPAGIVPEYGRGRERYDISGLSAEVKMRYTPSRVFDIHAKGSYTPQSAETGIFNGLDRPRWILGAGFELAPARRFKLGVDYEYRGVRRIYTGYYDPDAASLVPGGVQPDHSAADKMIVTSLRLPDICRLSAHIGWEVARDFTIRLEADNLLNSRFLPLPMTPTEGIIVKRGLQWLF